MSNFDSLKIDDLGLQFPDFGAEVDTTGQMKFGPTKTQLRSY